MPAFKKLLNKVTDDISEIKEKLSKFSSKKGLNELSYKLDKFIDSQTDTLQKIYAQNKTIADIKKTVETSTEELLAAQKQLIQKISALNPVTKQTPAPKAKTAVKTGAKTATKTAATKKTPAKQKTNTTEKEAIKPVTAKKPPATPKTKKVATNADASSAKAPAKKPATTKKPKVKTSPATEQTETKIEN